jgi:hypothetical protein
MTMLTKRFTANEDFHSPSQTFSTVRQVRYAIRVQSLDYWIKILAVLPKIFILDCFEASQAVYRNLSYVKSPYQMKFVNFLAKMLFLPRQPKKTLFRLPFLNEFITRRQYLFLSHFLLPMKKVLIPKQANSCVRDWDEKLINVARWLFLWSLFTTSKASLIFWGSSKSSKM